MPASPATQPDSLAEPPPASLLEELLTTQQVAALLQMRTSTVEDYARRGILPSLKLGRHRRYLKTHLEALIHNTATQQQHVHQRTFLTSTAAPRARRGG